MRANLDYYATPGPTTDLSGYADLVGDLPSQPVALARTVRGLLMHEWNPAVKEMKLPAARMADRERVGAAAIVHAVLALDPSPLGDERPHPKRMIGYCYHFAVLHCAFLRAKGIPARARCGFAAYFREGAWIDHWVVEYWDRDRWALIDPDSARDSLSPADFRNGGEAWMLCRDGEADPARHGNYTLWGWDELRGSLINDLGALNKVEIGHWDWCDWIDIEDRELPNGPIDSKLDALAPLVSEDEALDALRQAFDADPALRPPASLLKS